jgi:uncharacterized protein (TIGR02145 family)
VTHYQNGDEFTNITNNEGWGNLLSGAYGNYDNNPAYSETYGRLYNWYTVDDDRGVCPEGWRVPSDAEYTVLIDLFGGEAVAGGKLKESGHEHWNYYNDQISSEATNESGFTALPGGTRGYFYGNYNGLGEDGFFWPSTEYDIISAPYIRMDYHNSEVTRGGEATKRFGFSIRCIEGEVTTGCTDELACNYNPDANSDDGSCEYYNTEVACDCEGTLPDINGDCCSELVMDACNVCNGDGWLCSPLGDVNQQYLLHNPDLHLQVENITIHPHCKHYKHPLVIHYSSLH